MMSIYSGAALNLRGQSLLDTGKLSVVVKSKNP